MALYDTYGPKASASRQITRDNTPLAKVKAPTATPADPKAFDRKAYQRRYMSDYMRQRRRQARAAKA